MIRTNRAQRGSGSIRERLPGVWEIRVVVGFDAAHNRSVQRSFTVRGDATVAEQRRRDLVEDFGVTRVEFNTVGASLSVGELMERFFEAPHLWKLVTVASHRPVVRALVADPLACRRLLALTPGDVRAAICRWQADDISVATVSARWLVLRSAISWAVGEGVLRANSLAGVRGPPRPEPRRHHTPAEVRRLLRTAEAAVAGAAAKLSVEPGADQRPGRPRCSGQAASGPRSESRSVMVTSRAAAISQMRARLAER